MPSSKNSSAAGPLIKGYLPVRLSLQDNNDDETFFYIKQHFGSDNATLFVANVPCIPVISSRKLLLSLFARFGNVQRVTVIENPRNNQNETSITIFENKRPSFLPPQQDGNHGKFAHVVFSSPKEMKRVLREVTKIMSQQTEEGLLLERIEIQTLQDESKRQEESRSNNNDDSDDDHHEKDESKTGILAVAQRYRASCHELSRESLLKECNSIMEQYEDEEEAEKRARSSNDGEPDEDGFITVSYSSSNIGSKRDLEQAGGGRRRGGSKRSRKKKDPNEGFTDFYRFQTKESRKLGLQDLRKRFEQDLAKVKKMKEERKYRPF